MSNITFEMVDTRNVLDAKDILSDIKHRNLEERESKPKR